MCCQLVTAQKGLFIAPLDGELILAGNFAELRSSHFHAGIDISTKGKIGLSVKAAADGYVSRVAVSPYGYGHVVYITHKNGYTTVYGHLNEFEEQLANWVEREQYKKQSFRVNLFPPEGLFKYKQGEIIGFSGNSGSSGGPHLHFEIRETKSEHPVNPLLFGFDIKDDIRPKVEHLYVYALDDESSVSGGLVKQSFPLVYYDGKYHLKGRRSIGGNGLMGVGIDAIDYLSGSWSKCGVYEIKLFVDDTLYYYMKLDDLDYAVARSFQSHIDFEEKVNRNKRIHCCFVEPGNQLEIYESLKNNGEFFLKEGEQRNLKIEMIDAYGLSSIIDFRMEGLAKRNIIKEKYAEVFSYDRKNFFKRGGIKLTVPAGCLYRDLKFHYANENKLDGTYSELYKLHEATVPLNQNINIKIKAEGLPAELEKKALLAKVTKRGKKQAVNGIYKNGWVEATTRSFGDYCVVVDTIAPTIKSLSLTTNGKLSNHRSIRFIVKDEFSGINKYEGRIDGKWILFEYDAKKNLIFYEFDNHIEKNKRHELVFTVDDMKGNINTFKSTFYK